jgi:predicted transcriptional regulator
MPHGRPTARQRAKAKRAKDVSSLNVETHIITIFVIVAAVAIVLQTGILLVMYKALRQTSERMEGIAGRLEQQASPVLATASAILQDAQPKIAEITTNLAESSATIRAHVAQVGEATGEITERVRVQAARLDEFILNAAHKVEATSELLQEKVLSPMRRVRAVVSALNAGLSFLKSHRSQRRNKTGEEQDEEMFI